MTRRLYLHTGCSKTGTSSLQAGWWAAADALRAAGIGQPFHGRKESVDALLRPLGWRPTQGFAFPHHEAKLARVTERIGSTAGDALLVTNEDLVEARPGDIEAIARIARDADLELHHLLTARGWSAQLPSDYQQMLRKGLTAPYLDFLDTVPGRADRWAELFWLRQDVPGILERWRDVVPPERTTVVTVPTRADDPTLIFSRAAEALGYPVDVVGQDSRVANVSLGAAEAEVLRRVNLELERRPAAQDWRSAVRLRRAVAWRGQLKRSRSSAKLTLPPEHLAWVTEIAERSVAGIAESGVRVVGDLGELVPKATDAAALPAVEESSVTAATITVLLNLAEDVTPLD